MRCRVEVKEHTIHGFVHWQVRDNGSRRPETDLTFRCHTAIKLSRRKKGASRSTSGIQRARLVSGNSLGKVAQEAQEKLPFSQDTQRGKVFPDSLAADYLGFQRANIVAKASQIPPRPQRTRHSDSHRNRLLLRTVDRGRVRHDHARMRAGDSPNGPASPPTQEGCIHQ